MDEQDIFEIFFESFGQAAADYFARAVHDRCLGCSTGDPAAHTICLMPSTLQQTARIFERLLEVVPRETAMIQFKNRLLILGRLDDEEALFFFRKCPFQRMLHNPVYREEAIYAVSAAMHVTEPSSSDDDDESSVGTPEALSIDEASETGSVTSGYQSGGGYGSDGQSI